MDQRLQHKTWYYKPRKKNGGRSSLTLVFIMFRIWPQKHKQKQNSTNGTTPKLSFHIGKKRKKKKNQVTEWEKIFANHLAHGVNIQKI